MYKELSKINSKKNKQSNWKEIKNMEKHFTEETICMVNTHLKRYLTPLAIRELLIKATNPKC